MSRRVYSINTELHKVTGVQKVMLDIHHAVSKKYSARIVGIQDYNQINKVHKISPQEYIRWKSPFLFFNSIVFIHERKLLAIFWALNLFLRQNITIIYIHHSIFTTHRWLSFMPKTIVSISDKVTDNLLTYFKVSPQCIYKIHNTVPDINPKQHKLFNRDHIKIILPARINNIKRQIEIYQHLKGKIRKEIEILFVGDGPLFEKLQQEVKDTHFKILGFRNDIYNLLQECDYTLLFSTHEGLSITLIESAMCGTPIICNDVGGNCEIAHQNENAFIANTWEELINTLNQLPEISEETYKKMSQKSRQIYEKNFTFEKFQEEYLMLLEKVSKVK